MFQGLVNRAVGNEEGIGTGSVVGDVSCMKREGKVAVSLTVYLLVIFTIAIAYNMGQKTGLHLSVWVHSQGHISNEWKDYMENRGIRVSMNKTKVMISEKQQKVTQKAVRWPRGVCGRGFGNNSIQCTSCQKWVHGKCSGIKSSMYKVMKMFVGVA